MSWLLKITSINWVAPSISNQTVAISYRKGGTTDAYTSAGNITFSPSGAIVSTPNPFVIASIDDTWTSIQVKSVNSCNAEEVLKTFSKPA
jgi:hypothetical protein